MRLEEIKIQASRLGGAKAAGKSLNNVLTCSRVVAHSPVKVRVSGSTTWA
jgi:hypothetical protein